MGIGTNQLAERHRVPLPSLARSSWGEWIHEFATNVTSGIRVGRGHRYVVLGEMVVETKEVVVHRFKIGDVEDPDLNAAQPLWEWEKSEQGQWVMERALETPYWSRHLSPMDYYHQYAIVAKFDTKTLTEYYLRFGKTEA